MLTLKVENPWILKKYTRTGPGWSPLNPKPDTPTDERYQLWDKENIFYIVRTPEGTGPNGKGSCWKLGKASVSQTDMPNNRGRLVTKGAGGRARLTSYYNAYGNAKNFYVHTVYTFRKRKYDEAGEFGAASYRWVDSVFEKMVKNYLTGVMKVLPVRGTEYMEKLQDIETAVSEVMQEFTYAASIRRLSERLKIQATAVKAALNTAVPRDGEKKIKEGLRIRLRWDASGRTGRRALYDGIVGKKVNNKIAVWNVVLSNKTFKPENFEVNLNKRLYFDESLSKPFSWKFTSDERLRRERRAVTAAKIASNARARRAIAAAAVKSHTRRGRRPITRSQTKKKLLERTGISIVTTGLR